MLRSPWLPLAASSFLAAAMLNCSDPSAPAASIADTRRGSANPRSRVTPQQSGTTNRLQAISPVNDRIAWASGVGGTYAITRDGGATWTAAVVPGEEALEFRDVEAVTPEVGVPAGGRSRRRLADLQDGGWRATLDPAIPESRPERLLRLLRLLESSPRGHDERRGQRRLSRDPHVRRKVLDQHREPSAGRADGRSRLCRERNLRGHAGERQRLDRHRRRRQGTHSRHDGRRRLLECLRYAHRTGDRQFRRVSVAFRDRLHGILGGGELAVTDAFTDNVARSSDGGKTWQLANILRSRARSTGWPMSPTGRRSWPRVRRAPRGRRMKGHTGSRWIR